MSEPIKHVLLIQHLPTNNQWFSKLLTFDELKKLKKQVEDTDSRGMEFPLANGWDISIPIHILSDCIFMQKKFDLREITDDDLENEKFLGIEGTVTGLKPMKESK